MEIETKEKKDNSADNKLLDKNNRYYKLLCILIVIFSFLVIGDIILSNLNVRKPKELSSVYRFGKDSNYVIHHYDKNNKYIGKDSIVFIKDEVVK